MIIEHTLMRMMHLWIDSISTTSKQHNTFANLKEAKLLKDCIPRIVSNIKRQLRTFCFFTHLEAATWHHQCSFKQEKQLFSRTYPDKTQHQPIPPFVLPTIKMSYQKTFQKYCMLHDIYKTIICGSIVATHYIRLSK